MNDRYFTPVAGGKWVIGFRLEDRHITLAENSYLDEPSDAGVVLQALGLPVSKSNLDEYFPIGNRHIGRCPTIELMARCVEKFDPTNPLRQKKLKPVASV